MVPPNHPKLDHLIWKSWFWGTPILGNLHVYFLFIVRIPQRSEFKLLKLWQLVDAVNAWLRWQLWIQEHVQLHWAVINQFMSILVGGTSTNITTKLSWFIPRLVHGIVGRYIEAFHGNQHKATITNKQNPDCREIYTWFICPTMETPIGQTAKDGKVRCSFGCAPKWSAYQNYCFDSADKPLGFGVAVDKAMFW